MNKERKMGQQEQMLPIYQGNFSMLTQVSSTREIQMLASLTFPFPFPCVGLVTGTVQAL